MNQADDLRRSCPTRIWTVLIALGADHGDRAGWSGLAIAFFQALTQMQEMTLTFVPKIVAIFLGLLLRCRSSTRC